MGEVIHVALYGGKSPFGGRETPLEADVIHCDRADSCSFFLNNSCLRVRSFGGATCRYGHVERHQGYTSRARKYSEFRNKWRSHEKYGKLEYPKKKLGLINDRVVFLYPYISFERDGQGNITIHDPTLGFGNFYEFSLAEFTPELIHRICSFKPRAMFGGVIDSYQEEIVPLFLTHLEELLPDLYQEFVQVYPQYNVQISYIGRKAYLRTLSPCIVQYKSERYPEFDEAWYWDGELLHFRGGKVRTPSIVKEFEVVEFKIRPAEDTVITITSDDQVGPDTVFVD